ncbi:type IV secretion protein Rhs [Rodentibacter caecimuris]|uniref:type VI secretion system Vgr family protein n=1 Tax=Rodentibacter caecimuris TaxID=1796644 RepID=UPI0007519E74|nr:type VI secretion system tip protein TssI/VgrG [Rodentibacter heylii]AOF52402.1 VgrG-3 protein [Pasteurellaceae bacterium NI1060]MCQ9123127.1 type VI secretion system tip protein VgrG [Rodentibacter heylii]OOF72918.1 type IV secretion protein Rhs [Rodentibacter heylii]
MTVQSDYRYSLTVNGAGQFDVVRFELKEHLSTLFRLELDLASFGSEPDFLTIIDHPATLTFWQGEQAVRHVNGVVTALKQGKTGFTRTRYHMVIEPSICRAGLQTDLRIFQQQNSQEIIETLLQKNNALQSQFHLQHPYWTREYCVQYRETDLNFIERLAAEEGSYYYFEHIADNHTIHFSNNTALSEKKGNLVYNAMPAGQRPEAAVWHWAYQEKLSPTLQTLRDYTFTNPRYNQEHQAALQGSNALGEIRQGELSENHHGIYERYDYPGRYKRDAQGKPFTQYRLEYERREAELAIAQSDDLRVQPGYVFGLTGHQREAFNRDWLIVGVEHYGWQPGVLEEEAGEEGNRYENRIKLIPNTTQWRPEPQPRPVVEGSQMAHVVGPADEEIYCDEWGRVKVQFPWDREGQNNEHSSCWIRVSQGWAGAQFGHIAIPRIGHEVMVDFLEGDPDQPIITGRTYHSTTEPPYALPEHKTRMTIKSKTHKGNGFNELRFEDENGKEEVFIHAERDQNNVVKNDETTQIGHDRSEQVGNDETITIGNNRTETVGQDESLTVGRDQSNKINRNRMTKIEKDEVLNIGNHLAMDIYANQDVKTGRDYKHVVQAKAKLEVGELLKHHTKHANMEAENKVRVAGPGGTIIIDTKGITLKGKVTVKGDLITRGGAPEKIETLALLAHQGDDLCPICEAMKNKKVEN